MSNSQTLISITTCNRLKEVKKYIWDYIRFCNTNEDFDFLLSLDGKNEEYIMFCDKYQIPLLYSDEREGVGLSKNRICKQFPDYDYYFFIDDDVEIENHDIFIDIVKIMSETGVSHMCGNERHDLVKLEQYKEYQISKTKDAGGYFTVYSKHCLDVIGGWHPYFAKYKRYGHIEHSYRTLFSGLQDSPFVFVVDYYKSILLYSPTSVTQIEANSALNQEEMEMIKNKQSFYPLVTLSKYYYNNKSLGFNKKVDDFLKLNPKKYPLTFGKERREALADYYAVKIPTSTSIFVKMILFIRSFILNPKSVVLKHYVKMKLRKFLD